MILNKLKAKLRGEVGENTRGTRRVAEALQKELAKYGIESVCRVVRFADVVVANVSICKDSVATIKKLHIVGNMACNGVMVDTGVNIDYVFWRLDENMPCQNQHEEPHAPGKVIVTELSATEVRAMEEIRE